MRYAEDTSVPVERSKAEIDRLLMKYGAAERMMGERELQAVVQFKMAERYVRFLLPLPSRSARDITHYRRKGSSYEYERSDAEALRRWEQACRQRWRALCLVIKAKLEAVETAITTFEDEFLAHIVLPDGKTVGEHVTPRVAAAYAGTPMPSLLPDYTARA
jgi:hypothetical protein